MFSRLRDNLAYKLLALLCAIALRWYVTNQQNPRQTRTLVVTLMAQGIPDGYVLVDKNVPISVNVDGPLDALNRLPDDGVSATVDLTHAHRGRNAGLPVHAVVTAPGVRDLVSVSEIRPQTVSLMVEELHRRRLSLSVSPSGSPAAGYTLGRPATIPPDATVVGAADVVDQVARIVVRPHISGATGPVEEDDPTVAVDVHGNDVPDVVLMPDTAHVRVAIVESAREREAFVTPAITGALAPGLQVQSVAVTPPTVTLGGSADALAAVKTVDTDPVDLGNASADIVRSVSCVPPAGTTLLRDRTVTVTVHVGPILPAQNPLAAQPAPNAAPQQPGAAPAHP
jgi:YbbR domain-containing protein